MPDRGSSSVAFAKNSRKNSESRSKNDLWTLNKMPPVLRAISRIPSRATTYPTYQKGDAPVAQVVFGVVDHSSESASHVCLMAERSGGGRMEVSNGEPPDPTLSIPDTSVSSQRDLSRAMGPMSRD